MCFHSFLLEFGALLDTSADTRQLSAVPPVLQTNLAHLSDRSFNVEWSLKHKRLIKIEEK